MFLCFLDIGRFPVEDERIERLRKRRLFERFLRRLDWNLSPQNYFNPPSLSTQEKRGRQNAFLVPIRAIFVFMKMSVMDMVGLRTLKHWYFRLLLIIEMLSSFSLREIFSKKDPFGSFYLIHPSTISSIIFASLYGSCLTKSSSLTISLSITLYVFSRNWE